MKKIPLTKGKYAIVDDEDYPYLSRFTWHYCPDYNENMAEKYGGKYEKSGVYRCITGNKKIPHQLSLASFLIRRAPSNDFRLIHLNKDNLDFRKKNLEWRRIGLIQHNARKSIGKTSEYKGVYYDKKYNRFRAYITKDYKRYWLGSFRKERNAVLAFNKKARELNGKLAYQNKV